MKKYIFTLMTGLFLITSYGFAQSGTKIEAENFSKKSSVIAVKKGDGDSVLSKFYRNTFVTYNEVDFGQGTEQIRLRVASGSKSEERPQLEVKLGDRKGKSLGKIDVETKGWSKYQEYVLKIPKTEGKQTITIVSLGSPVLFSWFSLD